MSSHILKHSHHLADDRSTVFVPCTTTVTVHESTTETLTLWDTEIQTETVSIKDAETVTVWILTPAPIIMEETYSTQEVIQFTRDVTLTSFWTSTPPVETKVSTIREHQEWTNPVKGTSEKPSPSPCAHDGGCGGEPGQSQPPPAWTHATASGFQTLSATGRNTTPVPGAFDTMTTSAEPSQSPNQDQPFSVTSTIYNNQGSPFLTDFSGVERTFAASLARSLAFGLLTMLPLYHV